MKKKIWLLSVATLACIAVSTFMLTHLQHVNALKDYKPLSGVSIVLDPGHGGYQLCK